MLFVVDIDIKDSARKSTFATGISQLGNTHQMFENTWLLDSNRQRNDIYTSLRANLNDSDLILIIQTSRDDLSGWVPKSTIEWLNEHNYQ